MHRCRSRRIAVPTTAAMETGSQAESSPSSEASVTRIRSDRSASSTSRKYASVRPSRRRPIGLRRHRRTWKALVSPVIPSVVSSSLTFQISLSRDPPEQRTPGSGSWTRSRKSQNFPLVLSGPQPTDERHTRTQRGITIRSSPPPAASRQTSFLCPARFLRRSCLRAHG